MKNNFLDKNKMFDEISSTYDFVNDVISFKTHFFIKKLAIKLLNIENNSKILDLCCGTGDLTKIINSFLLDTTVIGADFSEKMLKIAKEKNPNNDFIQCDCCDLPFDDNTFDYIVIGFGLRNVDNRELAISEMKRVLKENGKLLHLDFGEHNIFSAIFDKILLFFIKFFKINAKSYNYLIKSKKIFPSPENLIKEFEGFKCIKIKYYLFKIISVQIFEK